MNQCIRKTDLWQMMLSVNGSDRLAVCKALESVGMINLIDVCVSGEPDSVYIARNDNGISMFVVDENGVLHQPADWAMETRKTIDIDDLTDNAKRFINEIAGYLAMSS